MVLKPVGVSFMSGEEGYIRLRELHMGRLDPNDGHIWSLHNSPSIFL